MNILYISYWGINEGLSQGTVLLNVKILSEIDKVSNIYLLTIERDYDTHSMERIEKVNHLPFQSSHSYYAKIKELISIPIILRRIAKLNNIKLIICRTSPAGNFGFLTYKLTGIRFIIESYEPHTQYMLDAGVWSNHSLRYHIQKYFDKKINKHAQFLIPPSHNYMNYLKANGIFSNKLLYMPCAVNLNKFKYQESQREKIRSALGISNEKTVGIYTGKFGDIYFGEEAFKIFKIAVNELHYQIIVLTPQVSYAKQKCIKYNIDMRAVLIKHVPHLQVQEYLSASDFAFSLIKTSKYRRFCSPVKNGEYWANGLPILIPENIGDDSNIVRNEKCGIVFNDKTIKNDLIKIGKFHRRPDVSYNNMAFKYRNPEMVRRVYGSIIDE